VSTAPRRQSLAALGAALPLAGRPSVEERAGHCNAREAAPPGGTPDDVTISRFDLGERTDRE